MLLAHASCARLNGYLESTTVLSFPCRVSVGSISVGASVGMALEESGDEEIDSIVRRADRALFAAKQAGRAQWRLAA